MNNLAYKIFKKGSLTFFSASLFFPKREKDDVFNLYAFVRTFDDFVDRIPQNKHEYMKLKLEYHSALLGTHTDNSILSNFIELQNKHSFDQAWVDAFFNSMEMDFEQQHYQSMEQTLRYIYGSAEVIGLMMARIMNLSHQSYPHAQALGRAFQYMNMIRDLSEDESLGRVYLPSEEYQKFGLANLSKQEAVLRPDEFKAFIASEISRYRLWRDEAKEGFHYIPSKLLRPIVIATEMFDYAMDQIEKNPMRIFEKKVKPSRLRILATSLRNII